MWCRLCLAINTNMSSIGDMKLKLFIEKIFKQYGIYKNIEVHDFACWGCKALLKKSYNFFQRVFKAQQELLKIQRTHETVNLRLLNTIHRQELSLDINLSYKKTSVDYFLNKDIKVEPIDDNIQYEKPEPIDDNIQYEKPSTYYKFDVPEKTNEDFEQNMIDSVDNKTMVESFENIHDLGSISNVKNNVWSDTEKVVSDEDECYIHPGIVKPNEHSCHTYSIADPFNELASTTENNVVVETNNSVPTDFDPKKVNVLTDIEFTKMKKRRNVKSTRVDYKSLLPSSSDTENSGNDSKKIKKNKTRRSSDDADFLPEKAPAATTSESSEDSIDDEGKRIIRPNDRRVFPMQCENCNDEIFQKRDHYRHYLLYHPNIEYPYMNVKQYLCQYCGRKFGKICLRNQHELTHSGKREFQCPICPKKFLNRNYMVRHKYRVHSTIKFTCDYCGRNTKTRGELVFHIRSHTGEKPYNCHICNAAFSHHAYRISHIKHAHGHNSLQTNTSKPKAVKQGKTKSADTKRGRKKGNAKKDDLKKKEKNIMKKRDKKKEDTKKSDAMKGAKVIPAVNSNKDIPKQKNIKEIKKERMDSASSEDEVLAFILNRKGPRQEM